MRHTVNRSGHTWDKTQAHRRSHFIRRRIRHILFLSDRDTVARDRVYPRDHLSDIKGVSGGESRIEGETKNNNNNMHENVNGYYDLKQW